MKSFIGSGNNMCKLDRNDEGFKHSCVRKRTFFIEDRWKKVCRISKIQGKK